MCRLRIHRALTRTTGTSGHSRLTLLSIDHINRCFERDAPHQSSASGHYPCHVGMAAKTLVCLQIEFSEPYRVSVGSGSRSYAFQRATLGSALSIGLVTPTPVPKPMPRLYRFAHPRNFLRAHAAKGRAAPT
jgi:hypothetical protein